MFGQARAVAHTGMSQFDVAGAGARQNHDMRDVRAEARGALQLRRKRASMARRWIGLTGALALVACSGGEPETSPAPAAAEGERLVVQRIEIAQRTPLSAEIATRDQAEALPRISGTLVELRVREGDRVAKGQLIARVVDTRLGHETGALAAQAAAAAAQAEAARAELARIEYLYRRGVYAKARLDQVRANARSAEAQLRAAREQRSASAAAAGQGAILAPATGRVLRADVPEGSVVVPGTSVATITAGPPVLRLEVPDSLARTLRPGAAVMIEDKGRGERRTGVIAQLYPAVSGGRVRADAVVPGLSTELVGQRVTVLVETGVRSGILVPRRFVSTRFGIDYVDLAGKDGSAMTVPVQTAPARDPAAIEILAGASAGDVLVARKDRP